jgi:NodT family efflux transporter outer membrane factor (OMF) lipoprotein
MDCEPVATSIARFLGFLHRNRWVRFVIPAIFGLAVLQGCDLGEWAHNGLKVGPNYTAPPAPVANEWIDYHAPTTKPSVNPDLEDWWHVFNDPVLNSLMHDAYGQNLTLRAAGERILQARAGHDIAVGNLFPQLQQLNGSYSVNKASTDTNFPIDNQWFQNSQTGFNVGWEIDFWGRFRRAIEASDASLDASVDSYDNVMVILLSDVASNYIQYRTFQERLVLARQNVEIQRQAYELAQNNFHAGASTERDMQQARQIYEQTRALIPQLEIGVRQTNDALSALLGIPVEDLSPRLGETDEIPTAPTEMAIGIPADLLRRRPDVRQAEREAAAQSALIGVEKSALYPHFAINGSIGANSEDIGAIFHTPGSATGSFGPSFSWDILNYGRIENGVAGQESRFRESVLLFEQTVLQADREAEDAIVSFAKSKEQEAFLAESTSAARRTVQITYDQYRHGVVDFTPVFLFELTLTQQDDQLAQTRGNIALSIVDLYRALGGGWEARLRPEGIVGPPTPAPTTQHARMRPEEIHPPTTNSSVVTPP